MNSQRRWGIMYYGWLLISSWLLCILQLFLMDLPHLTGALLCKSTLMFVWEVFYDKLTQGILTNETRCLWCETVSARDETFFDLSLDIEQNSSITSCLKNFSSTETLNAEDKFFCDKCCRYSNISCTVALSLYCYLKVYYCLPYNWFWKFFTEINGLML